MKSFVPAFVLLSTLGAGVAVAADVELPAGALRVEKFVPLSEIGKQGIRVVRAVDPLAVYSNVTSYYGMPRLHAVASGGITRVVMDDVTFTTNPGVGAVTAIRFSVANLNATSQSVRARVRFWNADGASLGAGLPLGPGTYYSPGGTAVGFSFAAFTFSPGVTTLTGSVSFTVPAGATTTLWAGLTFDNVGTTTGATDAELANFGQGIFETVDLGSSTDTLFETTAAGSFFPTNNPAGETATFGGSPVANTAWEFVVATLPVELTGFSVE